MLQKHALKKMRKEKILKKRALIIIIWFGAVAVVNAQDFYIKPTFSYYTPLLKNQVENFNTTDLSDVRSDLQVMEKAAKGISFGISLGKRYNKSLKVALDVNYLNYQFSYGDNDYSLASAKSDYNFKSLNLSPFLLFGNSWKNIGLYAKGGVNVGISSINRQNVQYGFSYYASDYETDPFISYGYVLGTEINYFLKNNPRIALSFECGVENNYYTPKKAKEVSNNGTWDIEYDEYVDEPDSGDNYQLGYKALKQTFKLSSVYFKLGLILNLRKNENN